MQLALDPMIKIFRSPTPAAFSFLCTVIMFSLTEGSYISFTYIILSSAISPIFFTGAEPVANTTLRVNIVDILFSEFSRVIS